MEIFKIIKEYNIKKKQTENLKKELLQKEMMIETVCNSDKDFLRIGKRGGNCVGRQLQNVYMDTFDDIAAPYFKYDYCENYNKPEKISDCIGCQGYEKYMERCKAHKDYNAAEQNLKNYPFWVKFVAFFQHKK